LDFQTILQLLGALLGDVKTALSSCLQNIFGFCFDFFGYSVATLKYGSANVPTPAFLKRQCFFGHSSPLYESMLRDYFSDSKVHSCVVQMIHHTAFGLESYKRSVKVTRMALSQHLR
jgi:hypothetical protein